MTIEEMYNILLHYVNVGDCPEDEEEIAKFIVKELEKDKLN